MRGQVICMHMFIFMYLIMPAFCTFPYSVENKHGVSRLQLEPETRQAVGQRCEDTYPLQSCEPGLVPAADAGEMSSQDGLAAWQVLTRSQYNFLQKSHGWRLDKWDRMKNICWSMTLMLRHAESHEDNRPVLLDPDGHMPVDVMATYRLFTSLNATADDIRATYRKNKADGGKLRFILKKRP